MEGSKRRWEYQEKKKMVVGGGGIGAVVLLGGALAAAAFVVSRKGRSSGKEWRRHQNQRPENEQDGGTMEVESDKDIAFVDSTQDEKKPLVKEDNSGTPCYFYNVEDSEQIMSSIIPKKLEKNAISDGSVFVEKGLPLSDEKSQFEPPNIVHENEVEIQLTEEDIFNEISDESNNLKPNYDGEMEKEVIEITEMQSRQDENTEVRCDVEEIEVTVEDDAVEGVHIDQMEAQMSVNMGVTMEKNEMNEEKCLEDIERSKVNISPSNSEDVLKALLDDRDSSVIEEHEHVNGGEKESALPIEIAEIIKKDEAVEGSQEEQVKYLEERLVIEQEECDQLDEGIVQEKRGEGEWTDEANQSSLQNDPIEVKENQISCEIKQENASIVHPTPENGEFGLPSLKEELIFSEDIEVAKEDGANEEVAESLEVRENKISMQLVGGQPDDIEDDAKKNIEKETKEELISPEDIEVTKGDGREFAESLELNGNKTSVQFAVCQPKDQEDDPEINIGNEVEEELMISPENIGVKKEDIVNEEVDESAEVNGNKTLMQFVVGHQKLHEDDVVEEDIVNEEADESVEVNENKTLMQFVVGQPELHEDDVERNIAEEVADLSGTIGISIAIEKDDLITEMSEDEEDYIKDFHDEVEEISEGNGDSVYPAESPQESSMEPGQVKLIHQEVEGKIQEDRTVKKVRAEESIYQKSNGNFPTMADSSSKFPGGKGNSAKNFIKYAAELATLKDYPTNSTRRRMLIGTLSVVSSLSGSWFLGLSSVNLCLIVIFAMVLSSMATARDHRCYKQRS